MEKKYIIELSDLNVFFISVGIIMLALLLKWTQERKKRQHERALISSNMEIKDLNDQKEILMNKNLELTNTIGSLNDQLKRAKKGKPNYKSQKQNVSWPHGKNPIT